jgi:hypothetical protein
MTPALSKATDEATAEKVARALHADAWDGLPDSAHQKFEELSTANRAYWLRVARVAIDALSKSRSE